MKVCVYTGVCLHSSLCVYVSCVCIYTYIYKCVCVRVLVRACVCVPDLQVHDDLPLVHVLSVHLHSVHPDGLQVNRGRLSPADQ